MTTLTLPTLLPIADAARKYGLSEEYIRALIQHGTIKAAMIGDEVVISESAAQEQARKPIRRKEDLPEYMKHAHLKGAEIGVGEAARKYTVPVSTLHGWATKGIIRIIRRDGQKVLLDEADVAYWQ